VTCAPITFGVRPNTAQFVFSVSSIRSPKLPPSPLAVAPDVLDAQLVGSFIATRVALAFSVLVKRNRPKPLPRATKS
jgi:hypothetical protein